ncbi:hypothetical protein JHK82_020898 [Glycine max]|nr:hypothetical protein JHK85_021347 [Glycine max]KAG5024998.1 hypothetical protein JHK86_020912 [Glycine max]KAG5136167.1 hypothetical protein JHK82_020898 [Glycine max]
MLGTALQFSGVRGEDRFYIPVKARKNQNQRKQSHRAKNNEPENADLASKNKVDVSENSNNNSNIKSKSDSNLNQSLKPTLSPSVEAVSNIDRFLEFTTPSVPAQYFSKTTMRGWKFCDVEYQSYFTLSDLWESFKEWSAYGAGVPLVLDQSDSVVQYYVPYLSAIQLYAHSAEKSSAKPRYTSEDSEGDYYRDSCSEGSSDYEYGKRTEFMTQRSSQHLTGGVSLKMDTLSMHDKCSTVQEGFSSDDSETGNPQDLLFEYPIYRIPTGPTLKDLDGCFLTYHTLHTPLTGSGRTHAPTLVYPSQMDVVPKISMPTFAMASYKLKGSIWMKKGVSESQQVSSLLQAADNWLRLVQVHHPDFQFFKSHGTYHR